MAAVQPWRSHSGNEELRAVGVAAAVGHGQAAGFVMFDGKGLVLEGGSVDRAAAHAGAVGEVAALDHEVGDDAVERGVDVARGGVLALCERDEVGDGARSDVAEQPEHDTAQWLVAVLQIEEDTVCDGGVCERERAEQRLCENEEDLHWGWLREARDAAGKRPLLYAKKLLRLRS